MVLPSGDRAAQVPLPRAAGNGRHRRAPQATAQTTGARRLDIQGLRAVAVLAVVVNHLTGHPRGGFIGVDVFFVISGYLITGLLLRDRTDRSLGQYLGAFYRRRIRRLLPSAMVVISATILMSRVLLPAARSASVTRDGGWSSIFWANWHFADVGTNYFTANGPTSPLQHYWSLSVEEQFYVVWPVLLFVVLATARARRSAWAGHAAVIASASILSAISLWLALRQSRSEPTTAYFSTYDRAWELGIGAVLAGALPYLRLPARFSTALSLGGLGIIAYALFAAHGGVGFPAPGAVWPCVGAAVVIAASGTGNRVLTNPAAVWIGDISYSVYLVHFPVIILLEARTNQRGAYFYVTAVALMCGLSILLHALVERPVLQSRWLLPRASRVAARPPGSPRAVRTMLTAGTFACLIALGANAVAPGAGANDTAAYRRIQLAQQAAGERAASPPTNGSPHQTPAPSSASPPATPQATRLNTLIATALAATSYPTLRPSMEQVIAGPQALLPFVQCARIELLSAAGCTWGDPHAPHVIYLVGDSTAMVYAEALAQVVEHTPGWRMRFAGAYGCHFASVVFANPQTAVQEACQAHTAAVTREIEQVKPDVLIVSHAYHSYTVLGQRNPVTAGQYAGYIEQQLLKVKSSVGRIVILAPPPGGKDPSTCYRSGAPPVECVYQPPALWHSIAGSMASMAHSIGAGYIDSESWFCSTAGYCPPFVDGTPVMHDDTHAAPGYMNVIWPAVKEALTAVSVFRPVSQ